MGFPVIGEEVFERLAYNSLQVSVIKKMNKLSLKRFWSERDDLCAILFKISDFEYRKTGHFLKEAVNLKRNPLCLITEVTQIDHGKSYIFHTVMMCTNPFKSY